MKTAEIILEYQNVIPQAPISPERAFEQAASNDKETMDYWRHIWLGNMTANKSRFGSFADYSCVSEWNKYQYGPAIVAGSGPSLKRNAHELVNRGNIPLISCLHNFHFFEDLVRDVPGFRPPEYYVTLDAGPVTIEEVAEGGSRTPEEYWELTKDRTLIASVVTHPELLAKWQGKILFYMVPLPDAELTKAMDAIDDSFKFVLTSGGNVLGICLSFSKCVLGTYTSIFIGADFSFGYMKKFHSWDSKYDKSLGHTMRVTDIYGNKVHTWGSYWNFKNYFDSTAQRVGGIYYNCSEGGCLGAYAEGNIAAFRYMDLSDCLREFNRNKQVTDHINNAEVPQGQKIMLYP